MWLATGLAVLCVAVCAQAFYIPGVAPNEFNDGDALEIKVEY